MKKHTIANRLIAGLRASGYVSNTLAATRKYQVFDRYDEHGKLIGRKFVGPMGALRTGVTVAASRSIGDPQNMTEPYRVLLGIGDAALTTPPSES